jgi:hypothetical protein
MEQTTVSQFYEWMEYVRVVEEEDHNNQSKLDWQLATLTAEVRRSWVKTPRGVRVKDFLMKFTKRQPAPKTKEGATRIAKQFWLTGFGIKWKDK